MASYLVLVHVYVPINTIQKFVEADGKLDSAEEPLHSPQAGGGRGPHAAVTECALQRFFGGFVGAHCCDETDTRMKTVPLLTGDGAGRSKLVEVRTFAPQPEMADWSGGHFTKPSRTTVNAGRSDGTRRCPRHRESLVNQNDSAPRTRRAEGLG